MGGVSPDGRVLWVSGRYDGVKTGITVLYATGRPDRQDPGRAAAAQGLCVAAARALLWATQKGHADDSRRPGEEAGQPGGQWRFGAGGNGLAPLLTGPAGASGLVAARLPPGISR